MLNAPLVIAANAVLPIPVLSFPAETDVPPAPAPINVPLDAVVEPVQALLPITVLLVPLDENDALSPIAMLLFVKLL